jgi:hypothetical protein
MGMTVQAVHGAIDRAAQAARSTEAALNAADAKLGDGDTGITVRRLFEAMARNRATGQGDLGAAFADLARICAGATGSSLGTLVTVAMMTLAKSLDGKADMPWDELSPRLFEISDRMLARGGASLGDKTVIDMLDAVARATVGMSTPQDIAKAARIAADATLTRFRDQPNRIGRARMFAGRSAGLDDPGMLAFRRLLDATIGVDVTDA